MRDFRRGTLEKWGLGWEVLREINRGLIMLRVTGYGQTGPYKAWPDFAHCSCGWRPGVSFFGMPKGAR